MGRIKGKFCPLTDELGNDDRFITQSTDLDKLLYILIMYTCNMTHHQAPTDPRYYKIRYGIRAKLVQIKGSMERLRGLYKGLSWADGKLSLLNSPTYEVGKVPRIRNRIRIRDRDVNSNFSAPSLDALKEYVAEISSKIDPSIFFDHYTSVGWKIGKSPMKDWKATVRNWDRRQKNNNTVSTYNPNKKLSGVS